jgi:hypothetical protein
MGLMSLTHQQRHWRQQGIELSEAEYFELADAQNHSCPICMEPLGNGEPIHVDHMKDGPVRGLLHQCCNANLVGANTVESALRVAAFLSRFEVPT